jgi:hypothetical protein
MLTQGNREPNREPLGGRSDDTRSASDSGGQQGFTHLLWRFEPAPASSAEPLLDPGRSAPGNSYGTLSNNESSTTLRRGRLRPGRRSRPVGARPRLHARPRRAHGGAQRRADRHARAARAGRPLRRDRDHPCACPATQRISARRASDAADPRADCGAHAAPRHLREHRDLPRARSLLLVEHAATRR